MSIGRQGRVQVEDIVFLIRKDPRKFARVKDLLTMNEELKRARKAFDEANYGSWFCAQAALRHYLGTCCPKGAWSVLFEGVIQDGGHCWDVCLHSQPFLRSFQAAEYYLIIHGTTWCFYAIAWNEERALKIL